MPSTLLFLFSLLQVVGPVKLLMILDLNIEVQRFLDYDTRERIWISPSNNEVFYCAASETQ